jgi:phage repressor protein C with HTH and peptisase S24 domain
MEQVDQRSVLEQLVRERREDYAALSRLIGKNPAYIQQFIKRGIPRRLSEQDRRRLAEYFRVDEELLGGPPGVAASRSTDLVPVKRLAIGASAGAGALNDSEEAFSHLAFDAKWLRRLCSGGADQLSIILVQGDSMAPTLADGDEIMVDRGDAASRIRDGIYVLRRDDELLVKRVAASPASRRITLKSDNPAYPTWPDLDLADLTIIGRVVWTGRKVR